MIKDTHTHESNTPGPHCTNTRWRKRRLDELLAIVLSYRHEMLAGDSERQLNEIDIEHAAGGNRTRRDIADTDRSDGDDTCDPVTLQRGPHKQRALFSGCGRLRNVERTAVCRDTLMNKGAICPPPTYRSVVETCSVSQLFRCNIRRTMAPIW